MCFTASEVSVILIWRQILGEFWQTKLTLVNISPVPDLGLAKQTTGGLKTFLNRPTFKSL